MVAKKTANKGARGRKKSVVDVDSPVDPKKSYTSEQLCHSLGIERTTLWRYRKAGLRSSERGGRQYFHGRDVQAFLFGEHATK